LIFEALLFIIVLIAAICIFAFWDLSAFVKVLQTICQDDGATISKGD
jgi:DNA-binding transcriptional regulator of glucitol operon